jgi:MoxR-like ATPase
LERNSLMVEKTVVTIHDKITALMNDLNNTLIERETAIELAVIALLTREHLLLLGPPGVAKSYLVRAIVTRLVGVSYFEKLLTKFSTPEELFGPLSLAALEHDEYKRVGKGSLQEAQIGFVDEIYKANSAILNSLLTLINERLYHEAGVAIPSPLISLFGASNESPEDESLNALHDRFIIRYVVNNIIDDDNFKCLLQMGTTNTNTYLELGDLESAQNEVDNIAVLSDAYQTIIDIKHALEMEGVLVSDRRWKATIKVLKAYAWLHGESAVSSDTCEILIHMLWSSVEQIKVVERVVSKITNPLNLEAVKLEDAAKELFDIRPKDANIQSLEPLIRQLTDIHSQLSTRINQALDSKTKRAYEALVKIEKWHKELAKMAFQATAQLSHLGL